MKYASLLFSLSVLLCSLSNCQPDPHAEGKRLANTYCGSCHLVPEPGDLTREIWLTEVLPLMGAFYGIYDGAPRQTYLKNEQEAKYLNHVFPVDQLIDSSAWKAIKEYYLAGSEDKLPVVQPERTLLTMEQFKVHPIRGEINESYRPLTTMVAVDEQAGKIYAGGKNRNQGILHQYAFNHTLQQEVATNSPPSAFEQSRGRFLEIGSLTPSDLPLGSYKSLSDTAAPALILDSLRRPLDVSLIDLNLDGQEETVIAEYGNMTGRLRVYSAESPPYNLAETPGAIKLKKADIDQDGHDDLLVLFAQGDERIDVFYAGEGGPKKANLVRFPPSYGSADFELGDYDMDGDLDIIYVNGDNYDYQPILKPYHGIRILENQKGAFHQSWFYPLDGAYGLEVEDFDQDGDLDIAAIAYFIPTMKQAIYSFVYLEQLQKDVFQPFGFEKARGQHFICLAKGDTDLDGDQDLIIGNFSNYLPDGGAGAPGAATDFPVYLWLENLQGSLK